MTTLATALVVSCPSHALSIDFNGGATDYTNNFNGSSQFTYSSSGGIGGTGGIVRGELNDSTDAFRLTTIDYSWLTTGQSVTIDADFLVSGPSISTNSKALFVGLQSAVTADSSFLASFGAHGGLELVGDSDPAVYTFVGFAKPTNSSETASSSATFPNELELWYHINVEIAALLDDQLSVTTTVSGGNLGSDLVINSIADMSGTQLGTATVEVAFQTSRAVRGFDNIAVVPEPQSLAALALGALLIVRRRRE